MDLENILDLMVDLDLVDHRGATGAVRAPKPDKTPIMVARRRCCLLFFKIKVRPGSCWSYTMWLAIVILVILVDLRPPEYIFRPASFL